MLKRVHIVVTSLQDKQDAFSTVLGVVFVESSFDRAICQLGIGNEHYNALGGIHGGVIFSLADIAFAAACNAGDGCYIGLQAEIRYISTTRDKTLTATARRVGSSKRLTHYQVHIEDGQGKAIALFTSTAYRLNT